MRAVLRAKWLMLVGRWGRAGGAAQSVSAAIVIIGVALGLLVFVLGRAFFATMSRISPSSGGPVLAAILGFLAIILLGSAAATAYSGLYASSDLALLLSWPLTDRQVFGVKLVEVMAAEAATFLVLGLPLLAAYGVAAGAPLWFYAILPVVTVIFHFLPTGLALLLNLLVMRLIPAHRAKEVGMAVAVLLGAVVYGAIQLAPAALGIGSAAEFGLASARLASPYLPTTWLAYGVAGAATHEVLTTLAGLGAAAVAGGALLGLALALVPAVFASGWAGETRGRRGARPARGSRASALSRRRALPGRRRPEHGRPVAGLVRKEILVVVRDAVEWSQLLYGLVIIGVLVLSNRMAATHGGSAFQAGPTMVYFMAMALSVVGVGPTLGLGAVAREGKARWLPLSAPLDRRDWLTAKIAANTLIALALVLGGALVLGTVVGYLPLPDIALVLAGAVATVPGAMAISVLIGAGSPIFEATDPRRRVSGAAGFGHFLLQLAYLGAASILLKLAIASGRWVGPLAAGVFAVAALAAGSWLVVRGCLAGAARSAEQWE